MSDYLDPQNEELLKDFFDEANLQVDLFEQNILALEKNASDRDAVDEMFRAAHTLKGAAATVQMQELAGFTHIVEDALDEVRSGSASATPRAIEALLQSIDVIKAMLHARTAGGVFEESVDDLIAELRNAVGLVEAVAASPPSRQAAPAVPPTRPALADTAEMSEYDILEFQDAAGDNETIYQVVVKFDENNPMNTVGGIQAYAALKDAGTVLKSSPDLDDLYQDVFYPEVTYFVAAEADIPSIEETATISDVTLSVEVSPVDFDDESPGSDPPEETPAETTAGPAPVPAETESITAKDAGTNGAKDSRPSAGTNTGGGGSLLRVDSKRIDTLLNLVSEAVINKASFNQLSQVFSDTEEEVAAADTAFCDRLHEAFDAIPGMLGKMEHSESGAAIKNELLENYADLFDAFKGISATFKSSYNQFKNTAQNLGRITGELQEGVMQIRMVPISQIFSRFPRLVRDVSKSLSKHVNLELEGQDTELDKSVIEDLLDPLIHCVRNAVDHGIEMPEERAKAGKADVGTITLKAANEGNSISIEISDDGKGISVDAVHKKAVSRGIIHPSKQLSDIEAFNLIFEPGFSTAAKVSDISGRGVGLDVVKKQIEKLNGSVTVWSEPGIGTKITIKLPLTLAIIQGLLIRVGPEVYAIPITSVLESQRILPDDIKLIDNYEVMNIRDEVVSLLRMDRLFGVKGDEVKKHLYVVVVGSEENKVGLIVDSLIGEEDVVIKPLRDRFTNSPGIAGATILGDGRVALIIDVSQLLELGLEQRQEDNSRRAQAIL